MAYHAVLNFEENEYDVVRCECNIERSIDVKGRPTSDLYGGQVTIQIESTDDNAVFESMASQSKSCSGTITFTKDEEDKKREIKWKNGYIIDLAEGTISAGKMPMSISFTVSAQSLTVGGVELKQDWPEVS